MKRRAMVPVRVAAALCLNPLIGAAVEPTAGPALLESPIAGDPLGVTVHRLDNGLTVYLSPNSATPFVTAWVVVRAGAHQNPPDHPEVAHLLEHMHFKGTRSLGTPDFTKEKPHLDRLEELYEELRATGDGAKKESLRQDIAEESLAAAKVASPGEMWSLYEQRGFTRMDASAWEEMTYYHCTFPRGEAAVWAAVESDRYADCVFRSFPGELRRVVDEMVRGVEIPDNASLEAMRGPLFPVHPFGTRTMQRVIDYLKEPSIRALREYRDRYYVPNNMAIVLAGDFDRARMLDQVRARFAGWKPRPLAPAQTWPTPRPRGVKRLEIEYPAEPGVQIGWVLVPNHHPDVDALAVAKLVMERIFHEDLIVAKRVATVAAFQGFRNDFGILRVAAASSTGVSLEQTEDRIIRCIARLRNGTFDDRMVTEALDAYLLEQRTSAASNDERAQAITNSFSGRFEWRETVERPDRLRRVGKADIVRVAKEYYGDDRVEVLRRRSAGPAPAAHPPIPRTTTEFDEAQHSRMFTELSALPR